MTKADGTLARIFKSQLIPFTSHNYTGQAPSDKVNNNFGRFFCRIQKTCV